MTLSDVIDAAVDGAFTTMTTLAGYFAGTGRAVEMPSVPAMVLALVLGLGGFFNQLRALRKQPA